MLSYINTHWLTSDKVYAEMVALSTDSLDISKIANGSKLYLIDTAKGYRFDEDGQVFREVNGTGTFTPPTAQT